MPFFAQMKPILKLQAREFVPHVYTLTTEMPLSGLLKPPPRVKLKISHIYVSNASNVTALLSFIQKGEEERVRAVLRRSLYDRCRGVFTQPIRQHPIVTAAQLFSMAPRGVLGTTEKGGLLLYVRDTIKYSVFSDDVHSRQGALLGGTRH